MTAWRKEDVDAARYRQEKRLDIARKRESQRNQESCDRTRKRRTCEATPIRLADESKEF